MRSADGHLPSIDADVVVSPELVIAALRRVERLNELQLVSRVHAIQINGQKRYVHVVDVAKLLNRHRDGIATPDQELHRGMPRRKKLSVDQGDPPACSRSTSSALSSRSSRTSSMMYQAFASS